VKDKTICVDKSSEKALGLQKKENNNNSLKLRKKKPDYINTHKNKENI
jgi:hypothetical protein